jgi:hypothetical protein
MLRVVPHYSITDLTALDVGNSGQKKDRDVKWDSTVENYA